MRTKLSSYVNQLEMQGHTRDTPFQNHHHKWFLTGLFHEYHHP